MIYHQTPEITVRDMDGADVAVRVADDMAHGWATSDERHRCRINDAAALRCVALAADYQGQSAGYVSVYFPARIDVYAKQGIPEIVDFGVLEKYRRRGIGTLLMDMAEKIAGGRCGSVCLGVGMHSGYGAAQRLYVKRGYVPDGSGLWYRDSICEPYGVCRNDDDLILYMVKNLARVNGI